ncbi:MAG: hypothetical protein HC897_13805, partial [Thermoanaerobaculia bacterium]|nr:hypothetical protein [Thermoanaerobaculia bacterium]
AESREVWRQVLVGLAERMPVVVVTHDPAAVASDIRHIACLNRRLTYHGGAQLTQGVLEETYGCPVELIAQRRAAQGARAPCRACRRGGFRSWGGAWLSSGFGTNLFCATPSSPGCSRASSAVRWAPSWCCAG